MAPGTPIDRATGWSATRPALTTPIRTVWCVILTGADVAVPLDMEQMTSLSIVGHAESPRAGVERNSPQARRQKPAAIV